jgi:hypothetical protein
MIYYRDELQHLTVGTEQIHRKPRTRRLACGPTMETGIYEKEAVDLPVNRHVRLPNCFIYCSR